MTPKGVHDLLEKYTNKDTFNLTYDIDKSHDNYIYDSLNDRELLDCFSFFASNPIGHNHPKMNDPEFEKKLLRVAKVNPSNGDIPTMEYGEFLKVFTEVAVPKNFKNLFFIAGGGLAVENALKVAFDWKMRKNLDKDVSIPVDSLEILHLRKAFHGRTGYTLSLTNTDPVKIKLFPKFRNWPKFDAPLDPEKHKFNIHTEVALDNISQYLSYTGKNKVAAIVLEPIQGEGGDRHFTKEFHQGLRKLASAHDCLLIYDEVQTGIGITGKMWAYEHFDTEPDIICFGKKMQVCGIMCTDRVREVASGVFEEKSRIDSTWGGNLTDMVRAQRYLEIIKEDLLVENARIVGDLLLEELCKLDADIVKSPRGRGLLCAFDCPSKECRNIILKKSLEAGLIMLACGEKSIRFRPSLTFTKDNVKTVSIVLSKVLDDIRKNKCVQL